MAKQKDMGLQAIQVQIEKGLALRVRAMSKAMGTDVSQIASQAFREWCEKHKNAPEWREHVEIMSGGE